MLNKIKKFIEEVPEDKSMFEENEKIINIVNNILELNRQQGQGLKILTPNQMLSKITNFSSSIKSRK